jgi:hypothetical protein
LLNVDEIRDKLRVERTIPDAVSAQQVGKRIKDGKQ